MADGFDTSDMLDLYLFENQQLLESLQDIVLQQKDEDRFDEDAINEIFRTMHTIKGSSGIMMFDNITKVAHKLEDIFYVLRESYPKSLSHIQLVEIVLQVSDFITAELAKIESGGNADGDNADILNTLEDFLNNMSGKGTKKSKTDKAKKNNEEAANTDKKFYIAPVSASSNFFKISLNFDEQELLANIHAYKTVFALKEIAEDLIYTPEDIISDDACVEDIIRDGFHILLQTQISEEQLKEMVKPGYDIKEVEINQCTEQEYREGFDSNKYKLGNKLTEAVEQQIKDDNKANQLSPGDFVIKYKEPGKAKKLAKDKKRDNKSTFINVDITKMDQLMELIGELVIAQSVVLQNPDLKVPGLVLDNFNKSAAQMVKISTDLQNVIMSMRMMPLSNTFQKMNRIVFDVSRKLGKDIEFVTEGELTEVDKNIIEHISDPLMHLVRNSVDHGIELPEEREKAGKTDKAKITLTAKTESGKVWIIVEDNGKGLDRQQIMNKARNQGLIDYSKPESAYTDKEVFQFITLPGFSTKEQVTEYSGRGVGMDVVLSNINSIGGSLDIESEKGKGTRMIMKIPLTLAIIDGIVMKTGFTYFVIETGIVKEFVSVTDEMMIHDPDNREFVMIRGECYPVIRLGDRFGLDNYVVDVKDGMMVIVEIEGQQLCLFVDKLVGKQEIVVKPIPSYIKKVRGLSGCTQLGDGKIALILDGPGIIN